VHVQTLLSSNIVIPSINDALDLFIDEQRLIATQKIVSLTQETGAL